MTAPRTICEAFQATAAIDPDAVALRTPGDAISITWREYSERVRKTATGLAALGVRRGDTVAIMLTNRPEFAIVDAGAMHLGVIAFSVYNTSSPEQLAYVFGNADNEVVVTETALLPLVIASGAAPAHVVCIDGKPDGATMTLEELEASAEPDFDFESAWQACAPDDILTLIYTSGTTGPPKGVQLTHENLISVVDAAAKVVDIQFGERITSFLPAAHVADRATSQYFSALRGVQVTYIANPREIVAALADTKPTIWFAVPRIWEKLKQGVEATIEEASNPVKRALGNWALGMVAKSAQAQLAGTKLHGRNALQYWLADKLVLAKIKAALGLQDLKWAWSGAAPIAPDTLAFFVGLGVPVCELWGMTETTGGATLNPPGKTKVGTVGLPLPGVEIKLAEDGEILVKSPGNMLGYRKSPDVTAAAFTADGWLLTGDIGTIDKDGYVSIVDRKKELIVNAAGKNMSPSNIENALKATTPMAATVVVIGEGRVFNVALISLDPDSIAAYARKAGLAADPAVLSQDPGLLALIAQGVEAGNAKLSRVEQVKKFVVLPEFWVPGGDELTPTLKLKRRPISAKYAARIEAMYTTS